MEGLVWPEWASGLEIHRRLDLGGVIGQRESNNDGGLTEYFVTAAALNHRSFGLATRSPNIVDSSTNWDRLRMRVHVVFILPVFIAVQCNTTPCPVGRILLQKAKGELAYAWIYCMYMEMYV